MSDTVSGTDFERRVQDLVFEALDESDPTLRARLVERLAGGDADLQAEVEARLRLADASAGPTFETFRFADVAPAATAGRTLGGDRAYRLIRELGSGGMGTVWLAARDDGQFSQQVAIKMLHGGAARTKALVTRFRTERQILATLDHPGIAKLLDGGVTADGTHYLVMEHVDGRRIDEHCRDLGLSPREIARLFVEICAAVEVAHGRLIVHRDLKPANILVTADGHPKLLDFGIAKLLAPEELDLTLAATEEGRSPLTLRYASPEQVMGTPIGTASDVYALGVVLYELLAGRSPYEGEMTSVPRLVRAICDSVPDAPSEATPALDRDLDAIVLEALRKEPQNRYPSVAALAEDLRRYLDGRPVEARHGTTLYRLGKLVARHRVAVGALVALFAVVAGSAFGFWRQARLIAAERDRVVVAEHQARDEAETARQVTATLIRVLEPISPEVAQGAEPTLRELLDRGAERLQSELADRPTVLAPLLEAMGTIYGDLGLPDRGLPLLERAVALRRERRAAEPVEYSEALSRLARLRRLEGDLEGAVRLSRSAWWLRVSALGPDAEPSLDELNRLVVATMELGRYDEAVPLVETMLQSRLKALGLSLPLALEGRVFGAEAEPLVRALHTRGVLAYYLGHFREAIEFFEPSLQLGRHVYGERNTRIAATETAMAAVWIDLGENEKAIRLLDDALAMRRAIQGESHPDLAGILVNRAAAEQALGRWTAVVADSEAAERILLASVGEGNPAVTAARNNRAAGLMRLGRAEEALALHRATLALLERQHPKGHADLVPTILNIGNCLGQLGRHDEAKRSVERGLRLSTELLGPTHALTLHASVNLGRVLLAAGDRRAGIDRLRTVLRDGAGIADAETILADARAQLEKAEGRR